MAQDNLSAIKDPLTNPEDVKTYDWYYGNHAGGMVLLRATYEGYKIHQVRPSYLQYCQRVLNLNTCYWVSTAPAYFLRIFLIHAQTLRNDVFQAFATFKDGLQEYAKTNYEEFLVPFGRKHKGKTIAQCRDKPRMRWTLTRQVLLDKVSASYFIERPQVLTFLELLHEATHLFPGPTKLPTQPARPKQTTRHW